MQPRLTIGCPCSIFNKIFTGLCIENVLNKDRTIEQNKNEKKNSKHQAKPTQFRLIGIQLSRCID